MVVALHDTRSLREYNAGNTVARSSVAVQEAVRIPIGAASAITRHRTTLGITDPLVVCQRRGFALTCQPQRIVDLQRPGMIEVEVLDVSRHALRVGKTRMFIFCSEARDGAGFGNRFTNCPW